MARSGRLLRPGCYPASCSLECGLSSPSNQGATTRPTWGGHDTIFPSLKIGRQGLCGGDEKISGLPGFLSKRTVNQQVGILGGWLPKQSGEEIPVLNQGNHLGD